MTRCIQIIILNASLLLLTHIGTGWTQTTVAVGDFENRSERMFLDSWAQKIPQFLQSELSGNPDIELVERRNLQILMDEKALSQSGLIDSSAAKAVGRLAHAQYLITGSVDEADGRIRIDAQVINTSTGKVFNEKVQSESDDHLNDMVKLLAVNLKHQLTGKGVYQSSMTVAHYPVMPFAIATAALAGTSLILHQQYLKRQDAYQSETRLDQIDNCYTKANRMYRTRNGVLGVTGGVALTTLVLWISSLSAEEIVAGQPPVLPYCVINQQGDMILGCQITF
jgi:TolB-like protein